MMEALFFSESVGDTPEDMRLLYIDRFSKANVSEKSMFFTLSPGGKMNASIYFYLLN